MWRLLVGLWIYLMCGPALAGEAHEWLQRMHQAMETLSYRGTVVYAHGDQLDVVRVLHRHDGANLRERLYTLTGSQREVVRENGEVRCLFPEDTSVMVKSQLTQGIFPEFTLEQWEQSRAYYKYKVVGDDRVAGMSAQIIDIAPKLKDRYGYRLWIDRDSGLLLRSMLRDHRNRTLEQISFTDVEITQAISDEELRSAGQAGHYLTLPKASQTPRQALNSEPEWQPTHLPPGFVLVAHDHIDGAPDGGETGAGGILEHMVYSDGLASVSIYVESLKTEQVAMPTQVVRGSVNLYSRRDETHLITSIGELPYSTLQQIGDSVRRGQAIAASAGH